MNAQIVKWAGGVLVLISLCGFIGRSSVRMSRIESESEKVKEIQRQMLIVNLYLKLQDPELYNKAERLAN